VCRVNLLHDVYWPCMDHSYHIKMSVPGECRVLDRCFPVILQSLQIDEFSDYYRTYEDLTDEELEIITSSKRDRRERVNCIVQAAKRRERRGGLTNFKEALEQSGNLPGCSPHEEILQHIEESMDSYESDNEVPLLSRNLSRMSLSDHDEFVASEFKCICCAGCNTEISQTSCLFDQGGKGYKQEHVNPHGYHHVIITVTGITCRPDQINWDSNETDEHTWFPGYKWKIIYCNRCSRHLGWRFRSANADPRIFFGLRRPSVLLY